MCIFAGVRVGGHAPLIAAVVLFIAAGLAGTVLDARRAAAGTDEPGRCNAGPSFYFAGLGVFLLGLTALIRWLAGSLLG